MSDTPWQMKMDYNMVTNVMYTYFDSHVWHCTIVHDIICSMNVTFIWSAIKRILCIQIKNWVIERCDTKLLYRSYLSRTILFSGSVGWHNPRFWDMLLIRVMVGCMMVGILSPCFHACVSYLCPCCPPLSRGWDDHYIVDRAFKLQFDPVIGTLLSTQRYLKQKQTIKQNF